MSTSRRRGNPAQAGVDSYVVRIYRRPARRGNGPETLTGLIEDANNNSERLAFHSMSELWDILCAKGAAARPAGRPAGTRR